MSRLELIDDRRGAALERGLHQSRLVLGRAHDVDWRFDDPAVSRRHAVVHHFADRDEIEDLGSAAGTLVNGRSVHGRHRLRGGDVVQLASVRLRYVDDLSGAETSRDSAVRGASTVTFEIDQQHADVISNVARDQYNNYIQQIIVKREDAMSQIASMSRTARALALVGQSLAAAGVLSFIGSVVLQLATGTEAPIRIVGVPLFALAMGVALLGFAFLFGAAIATHAASTRKHEVDRQYPLPPGWGGQPT